jgi:hypothetical protein
VKIVEARFVARIFNNEEERCNGDRQSQDVDEGKNFISDQPDPGERDISFQHEIFV